jgi:DNA-binding NtrC family response regulator
VLKFWRKAVRARSSESPKENTKESRGKADSADDAGEAELRKKEKIKVVVVDKDERFLLTEVVQIKRTEKSLTVWVKELPTPTKVTGKLTPLEEAEKKTIEEYLELYMGVKNQVRKALGITVNTLQAKIKKYGITVRRTI